MTDFVAEPDAAPAKPAAKPGLLLVYPVARELLATRPREALLAPDGGGSIVLGPEHVRRVGGGAALERAARSISGKHLALSARDGALHACDLGSTNGTRVDGVALAPKRWVALEPGAVVRTGRAVFVAVAELTERLTPVPGLSGASAAIEALRRVLVRLAAVDGTVTLVGEPGTGKDVIARALHALRPERGSYLALNLALLRGESLQSELFGHVRGAYTEARSDRKGAFLEVGEGTLFLDELPALEVGLQAKLLRALTDPWEVQPLGASRPVRHRARVVVGSQIDPKDLLARGALDAGLHRRLAVHVVRVPPLRERPEDILILLDRDRALDDDAELGHLAAERLLMEPWRDGNVGALVDGARARMDVAERPAAMVREWLAERREPARMSDWRTRRERAQDALQATGQHTRAAQTLGISTRQFDRWLAGHYDAVDRAGPLGPGRAER